MGQIMKPDLYFLALVPPQPQLEQLQVVKERFAEQYECRVALRSPPHITLIPPFRSHVEEIAELKRELDQWSKGLPGFDLQLTGYGCFSPRVIFLNVIASTHLLNFQIELHQQLKQLFTLSNKGSRPFRPHLTLGTRDLKKSEFHRAWADLQNQEIEVGWGVDRITLLKHNGKSWDVHHSFPLGPP